MGVFKMLTLYFILFTTVYGFLLDIQQSNGGQSLPPNQYMTLSKFMEEEKRLQQKMENLQQDTNTFRQNLQQDTETLRHDMDNSFVVLTAQLQQKLDFLNTKLANIEKNNGTNQDVLDLVDKNKALEQSYNDLKKENAMLQSKYNQMEIELQVVKNNTKHLNELQRNKSLLVDQEITSLKQLGSIQPLQEIKTLQQTVQTISAQTNSLSMKERARSQDFLALYNMTTHSLHELEVRTQSIGTKLSNIQSDFMMKFDETENRDNRTLAHLHDIERKSEATENRNNLTFSQIQQQIKDSTEQVAITAQLTSSDTSAGAILKFDDVKLSVGISNHSEYKRTGIFICERKGLYMISASITSDKTGAYYTIYLNGKPMSETYIVHNSNNPSIMRYNGAVVLALQLSSNDSVWVYKSGSSTAYGGLWSTLTIVKIK